MLGRVGSLMAAAKAGGAALPDPTTEIFFGEVDDVSDLPAGSTYTRASGATFVNSLGNLEEVGVNVMRPWYRPGTLVRLGLLLEESSTNGVRNPRCEGAIAGAPGTLPTHMTWSTTPVGLAFSVVGTGTESGIPYLDVRVQGTRTTGADWALWFQGTTGIAAVLGQTWTASFALRLVAGSLANVTRTAIALHERNGTGLAVANSFLDYIPSSAPLSGQRVNHTRTLDGATTAYIAPNLLLGCTLNRPVDFTLRIGAPQCEQRPYPTSVILPPPGAPAATTRARDVLNLPGNLVNYTQSSISYSFGLPRSGSNGVKAGGNSISYAGDTGGTAFVRIDAPNDIPVIGVRAASADVLSASTPNWSAARDSIVGSCVAWGGGSGRSSWDGAVAVEDASVPSPAPASPVFRIGMDAAAVAGQGSDAIHRRLRIWSGVKLTAAETQKASHAL